MSLILELDITYIQDTYITLSTSIPSLSPPTPTFGRETSRASCGYPVILDHAPLHINPHDFPLFPRVEVLFVGLHLGLGFAVVLEGLAFVLQLGPEFASL